MIKRVVGASLLAAGLVVSMVATPAQAAGVATVSGGGTISPALVATQAPQSHNFTFSSVTITTTGTVNGNSSCTASGTSTLETYAEATGTGTYRCSGAINGGGTLTYSRTGNLVTVTTSGATTATLECVFTPTTPAPGNISSYSLSCTGTYVLP